MNHLSRVLAHQSTSVLESSVPIISFSHVTKDFNLLSQKTFKEFLPALFGGQQTQHTFTALSDISFTVNRGETLGIIGPNGSGKSTILKLIAGVMTPTYGKIEVRGKVSPLIELGAGMHPELSGKENIYLNGAILGLKRTQIDEYYNSIVDFAELWEFIDQPVKHYSSGMYMRLAFAIAVHVDPEILIVDEILAVGDYQFQQKCYEKIRNFQKLGKTIILVTHDLSGIKAFCNKALIVNRGKEIKQGNAESIVDYYIHALGDNKITVNSKTPADNKPAGKVKITNVEFLDSENKQKSVFLSNDPMSVLLKYESKLDIKDIVFGLAFYHENGLHLYGTNTLLQGKDLSIKKGKGTMKFTISNLPVLKGRVSVTVAAHTTAGTNYDWKEKMYFFDVFKSNANSDGIVDFNTTFSLQE